ncbi:hypothetical protein BN2475_1040012 [Paraburkholderia ribeironis]|uniref:Uncharacterized protein n=1 Tax=Paraburkholderia ribeironis TaxID=1247936 RepID=A0A1N7SNH7_9BURK|nr:hypothetical protein BN2475_1040012 [Paraburkholderia ribeironis]
MPSGMLLNDGTNNSGSYISSLFQYGGASLSLAPAFSAAKQQLHAHEVWKSQNQFGAVRHINLWSCQIWSC